jgi:hypothetical protein
MKFLSIKEYFYKLNTIGFILLLLPSGVFIFLYNWSIHHPSLITQHDDVILILSVVLGVLLVDLTIVHWVWINKIRRLKKLNELAKKMDGYFVLMLVKMAMYCGSSLMMAIGYFLTDHSGFTGLFVVLVLAGAFQWPTPSAFCRHLGLNRNERDMVLNNRDLYQINKKA